MTRVSGSPAEASAGAPRERLRRELVRAWWWAKAHGCLDRAGGPDSCSLLIGSARSGTTWLGELLDRHHDHRVIFEPFKAGVLERLEPFRDVRYLPPGTSDPAYVDPVRSVLAGQFRNGWVDHTNRSPLPRRRLLKEVRVNGLAPWLATQFPHCPMVLLVRHPLAVVASRQQLRWTTSLDGYARDPGVRQLLSAEQERLLCTAEDPFDAAVVQWALETWLPLQGLRADQVLVVLYEQLVREPRLTGEHVLRWVGQQPDDEFERAVSRPSRTSRPESGAGPRPPRRGGPGPFDAEQRDRARDILRAFELEDLYDVHTGAHRPEALAGWGHRVR